MRNALFYLTYNGIYNFTSGIGTQTQLLLSGLERLQKALVQQYGPLVLHLVCPAPDQQSWGYDPHLLQSQRQRLAALGGKLHFLSYKTAPAQEFWEVAVWQRLSAAAAHLIARESQGYTRCLVLCVDQPWLHTPRFLARTETFSPQRVQTLLVPYSTAVIRNAAAPDKVEMAWEQEGLASACHDPRVALADLCPSFTVHLRTHFHLPQARFAPYTASVLVDDDLFSLWDEATVVQVLQRYGVPPDVDLVVAFGRAAPVKGFDLLIPALAGVRHRCHFVLISVAYPGETYQQHYDQLLATHRIPATHIRTFTRELPRALCQWSRTRLVAVPSRQETFSNIPLEVALWARRQGPVVVAARVGGFLDQLADGVNGFLMDCSSPQAITATLQRALALPAEKLATLRRRAYERVVQRYDFRHNFPRTLQWFWGDGEPCQATACGEARPRSDAAQF
jgi:glycosyltransferase involved in cell wall biosynthesis